MNEMRILIIDDESNIRRTTSIALEALGNVCEEAGDSQEALRRLQQNDFDVAFLDLKLGTENGLDLVPSLLAIQPRLSIIVFTAYSSIDSAVEAIRRGAMDYISKPFTPDSIRQVLGQAKAKRQLERRVLELESTLPNAESTRDFITKDSSVQKIYELTLKAADSLATILILGESGTGKSLLAHAIHKQSPRRIRPFITVSCPSLSRELLQSELFGHVRGAFTGAVGEASGKVKAAEGGTLFLDEIGELPLEIQPKLLRLLQEREFERVGEHFTRKANIRVIAATNQPLEERVKAGMFREDLYHRLNVISVEMPPLRQRPLDIEECANHQLKHFRKQLGRDIKGFSRSAILAMQSYPWPGNLRELRNVIERAVILTTADVIDVIDLPEKFKSLHPREIYVGCPTKFKNLEREHIKKVVDLTKNMEEAAKVLGIDPATLFRKRKRYAEEALE